MKLTHLFNDFFNSEKTGGLFLVFVTLFSLILSNSSWQKEYINIWHDSEYNLVHWINDGLMSIFFLLIGLELEREFYIGELSDIKNASFPLFGALGGMLIPAGLFLMLNSGSDNQAGFGIPMATDIAFAIGILSLLGNKIPKSLKVFLAAFAVIDDLGAIILIAIFYTTTLTTSNLLIAFGIFGLMLLLNRLKIHNLIPYIIGGIFMWYFMLNSGVHPTITGVLLAFAVPFGDGGEKSPSFILQHFLHKPVAFLILPLFALANTSIAISGDWYSGLGKTYSLGIILGLLIGKPLGIWLFSFIGVKSKLCLLPSDLNWKNIFGVGILGGIGFTMSIFITLRAFANPELVYNSKIAILIASLFAGIIGLIYLKSTLKRPVESEESR
jgi:Na+:H+ antiporter, NhaA family